MNGTNLRQTVLETVEKKFANSQSLQAGAILREVKRELGSDSIDDHALLTAFYDLFRSGVLAWGHNLNNAAPPFAHLTEHGRKTLEHISGDPSNKDGYLALLKPLEERNPVAWSYISEAVETYNAGCYKATAVMIGASAEAQVLELREEMLNRLNIAGADIPGKLKSQKVKIVRDKITQEIDACKQHLPLRLREIYSGSWILLTESMRISRNDAGHPSSIDPMVQSDVHALLLQFPRLVELVKDLKDWVSNNYP